MRALATLRKIAEVRPIEGADMIVAYRVDGWWVVDKINAYRVNDPVVFCEVDSWVPHELAPFLSKGKEPRVFEGVRGERLRTVKLKGQLSQGLLLRPSDLDEFIPVYYNASDRHALRVYTDIDDFVEFYEGDDVSEVLGIKKWEPTLPAQLAGQVEGHFPQEIPKTDQERVQNIRNFSEYQGERYEITEKLHGSSCTFYLDNDDIFHVCSRNWDLKPDENNAYWKAAIKYNAAFEMKRLGLNGYAIQGELCGEGINGNNYKLGLEFFAFDVYKVGEGYLEAFERHDLIEKLGMKHVPIMSTLHRLTDSADALLQQADGKSTIADCKREGFVYKSHQSDKTFKVVSNAWLLKYE